MAIKLPEKHSGPVHVGGGNVSGVRFFFFYDFFKWHGLNVSTITVLCMISLQKPVESLPMFYRVLKLIWYQWIFYEHVYQDVYNTGKSE